MPYRTQDLAARELDTGTSIVRPLARADAIWRVGKQWAGGFSYLRPAGIEIEHRSGRVEFVPIRDRQLQIRLAAIALVIAAFVLGRIRDGRH